MTLKQNFLNNFLVNEFRSIINWNKLRPINGIPHGHFYSPIISKNDMAIYEKQLNEDYSKDSIQGIDLNLEEQLSLIKSFSAYYNEIPFPETKNNSCRYYFCNNSYSYTDAIILYSFIRHFKPERIIEIGSGFTSALMLDTKDHFLNDLELTFIEPYPQLLFSLLSEKDKKNCKVFITKVQDVALAEFKSLEANDILFIDSSHVSKTGSDVNFEIFKILPTLKPGVFIHFHDIFYPFEYPKELVYKGFNWNEDYLLKAFLSYNDHFKIVHFSQYIHNHHPSAFNDMPLAFKNSGGNLWIKKIK
ncbi:MAG: class I SAM-dependent methyltransferase [Bacteroidota bacterium]